MKADKLGGRCLCSYILYPNEKISDKFDEMVDLDICNNYQQCELDSRINIDQFCVKAFGVYKLKE